MDLLRGLITKMNNRYPDFRLDLQYLERIADLFIDIWICFLIFKVSINYSIIKCAFYKSENINHNIIQNAFLTAFQFHNKKFWACYYHNVNDEKIHRNWINCFGILTSTILLLSLNIKVLIQKRILLLR